jgi:hypothetical protein
MKRRDFLSFAGLSCAGFLLNPVTTLWEPCKYGDVIPAFMPGQRYRHKNGSVWVYQSFPEGAQPHSLSRIGDAPSLRLGVANTRISPGCHGWAQVAGVTQLSIGNDKRYVYYPFLFNSGSIDTFAGRAIVCA